MSRSIPLMFFAICLSLTSCVTTKTYIDEEKKMRFGPEQLFVIKASGEKVVGAKLSTPKGFDPEAGWVKLDGHKYQFTDLRSYQDKHAYFIQFNGKWIKQLKRGKINVYYYEVVSETIGASPSGGHQDVSHEFFVFQKGDGPLQQLSKEGISQLLSDNREAQDKFDARFKPGQKWLPKQLDKHPKVLFECVDIYNNG
jgi:hypothetical protein